MKPVPLIWIVCITSFCYGFIPTYMLTGCMTDGSSAVSTINATVTHTEAGDWIGGLTFTFKDLPTESEAISMERSGAIRVTEKVFVLPPKDAK